MTVGLPAHRLRCATTPRPNPNGVTNAVVGLILGALVGLVIGFFALFAGRCGGECDSDWYPLLGLTIGLGALGALLGYLKDR